MQADSYGHHRTVGLCQRLMCWNGELKAKQERQQGIGQQKVFEGAGTWASNRDQLCLKLAGLLRSPRAFCRNVCGREAGEDWRFGSPPLGSSSCPPFAGPPTSPADTLSPPVNGPTHILWSRPCRVLWRCHQVPNSCLTMGWPFTMYEPHLH